jgi:protein gp37
MSDLFHVDVPDEFVLSVFDAMLAADWHIYQVLTKRPARAAKFWNRHRAVLGLTKVPDHIWIGTSIENDDVAYRARHLGAVDASVRFLSCEPLIGPLNTLNLAGIHWVIGGGESGSGARPVDPSWAIALRDLCARSQVPFFWKQWGGRTPKAGGRLLDGELWSQYPSRVPSYV